MRLLQSSRRSESSRSIGAGFVLATFSVDSLIPSFCENLGRGPGEEIKLLNSLPQDVKTDLAMIRSELDGEIFLTVSEMINYIQFFSDFMTNRESVFPSIDRQWKKAIEDDINCAKKSLMDQPWSGSSIIVHRRDFAPDLLKPTQSPSSISQADRRVMILRDTVRAKTMMSKILEKDRTPAQMNKLIGDLMLITQNRLEGLMNKIMGPYSSTLQDDAMDGTYNKSGSGTQEGGTQEGGTPSGTQDGGVPSGTQDGGVPSGDGICKELDQFLFHRLDSAFKGYLLPQAVAIVSVLDKFLRPNDPSEELLKHRIMLALAIGLSRDSTVIDDSIKMEKFELKEIIENNINLLIQEISRADELKPVVALLRHLKIYIEDSNDIRIDQNLVNDFIKLYNPQMDTTTTTEHGYTSTHSASVCCLGGDGDDTTPGGGGGTTLITTTPDTTTSRDTTTTHYSTIRPDLGTTSQLDNTTTTTTTLTRNRDGLPDLLLQSETKTITKSLSSTVSQIPGSTTIITTTTTTTEKPDHLDDTTTNKVQAAPANTPVGRAGGVQTTVRSRSYSTHVYTNCVSNASVVNNNYPDVLHVNPISQAIKTINPKPESPPAPSATPSEEMGSTSEKREDSEPPSKKSLKDFMTTLEFGHESTCPMETETFKTIPIIHLGERFVSHIKQRASGRELRNLERQSAVTEKPVVEEKKSTDQKSSAAVRERPDPDFIKKRAADQKGEGLRPASILIPVQIVPDIADAATTVRATPAIVVNTPPPGQDDSETNPEL